jgi:hypothetical protein
VKKKETAKALEVSWSAPQATPSTGASSTSTTARAAGTHRIAFTVELPVATARSLKSFEVKELTAQGKPLEHHFPTAMVERFGGRALLHVYVVFPPRGKQNVFYVERDFRATFAFARS